MLSITVETQEDTAASIFYFVGYGHIESENFKGAGYRALWMVNNDFSVTLGTLRTV